MGYLRISIKRAKARKLRKEIEAAMNNSPQAFVGIDNYAKVARFLTIAKIPRGELGALSGESVMRSLKLIVEEVGELTDAIAKFTAKPTLDTLLEVADALIDIEYVINNMHHDLGLPAMELFNAVHAANLAKLQKCRLCATGCEVCDFVGYVVIRNADGKILKPEGWKRPDLYPILYEEFKRSRERLRAAGKLPAQL